jgi:hypothetical protein
MLARTALAFLSVFAIAFLPADPASAQRDRDRDRDRDQWELLGTQTVGFGVDRDVVRVGRREGRFERLRIEVHENDINLYDLKVVFGNGEVQDIPVRERIRAGGRTRPLDLRGGDRVIDRIELIYQTRPGFGGRAVVQVYGQRGDDRRADRDDEWVELGCQRVGFIADRDVIRVGREEGRFSAIQLRVADNAIHVYDLKVIYANGAPDDIRVRSELRPGERTRPLDLRGERRAIRQIEMVYGSRPNFRGQARVCVYGRR